MNKLKQITALIFLFTAFIFSSCETEPIDPAVLDNIDNPNVPTGVFKVDFNGQTYEATTTSAIIADGVILIGGSKGTNGENIGIILDGTTIGAYTDNALISYNPSDASEYDYANLNEEFVTNGSVIITEINTTTKIISGTFSFIGYWSDYTDEAPPTPIEFTNGTFSIPYTTNIPNPDPEDPLEGSFTVNIDGTPFVANGIIAVRTVLLDPVTDEPMINPDTNLPFIAYSIVGKYNETKIVSVQFTENASNSYDIPEDGGVISYVPNALNPMEMYSGMDLESDENIGNITVLSNNTTTQIISGTFNCKVSLFDFETGEATDVKQLTNGVFEDVHYVNQ